MITRDDHPLETGMDILHEFQLTLSQTARPSRTRRLTDRDNTYSAWLEFTPRDGGNAVPSIPFLPWRDMELADLPGRFTPEPSSDQQTAILDAIIALEDSPQVDSRTLNIMLVGFPHWNPQTLRNLDTKALDKADVKDQLQNLALDNCRNGGKTWTWKPGSDGPFHVNGDYTAAAIPQVIKVLGNDKIDLILFHYDLCNTGQIKNFMGTGAQAAYSALSREKCLSTGETIIPHFSKSYIGNLRGTFVEVDTKDHPLELTQRLLLALTGAFCPGVTRQKRHAHPWLRFVPSASGSGPPPVPVRAKATTQGNPSSPSARASATQPTPDPSEAAEDSGDTLKPSDG